MTTANDSFGNGMAPRWAALIAGLAYLSNPVAYAEFYAYPKLVVAHDTGATIANINNHGTMFAGMVTCYLLNFIICDVVMAWAVYLLLAPVNRALSTLAAWFQLVYASQFTLYACKVLTLGTDDLEARYKLQSTLVIPGYTPETTSKHSGEGSARAWLMRSFRMLRCAAIGGLTFLGKSESQHVPRFDLCARALNWAVLALELDQIEQNCRCDSCRSDDIGVLAHHDCHISRGNS